MTVMIDIALSWECACGTVNERHMLHKIQWNFWKAIANERKGAAVRKNEHEMNEIFQQPKNVKDAWAGKLSEVKYFERLTSQTYYWLLLIMSDLSIL